MYGLKDTQIIAFNNVFARHPEVEQVIIFGSRAKGNYKPSSDIDLALIGAALNSTVQNKINEALDDLLLPYLIDLNIFHQLSNVDLIDHIKTIGKIIYDKNYL